MVFEAAQKMPVSITDTGILTLEKRADLLLAGCISCALRSRSGWA